MEANFYSGGTNRRFGKTNRRKKKTERCLISAKRRFVETFFCFVFVVLCFGKSSAQFVGYEVKLWIHDFEDSIVFIKGAYGQNAAMLLDTLKMQKDGSFVMKGNYHSGIVIASSLQEDLFSFLLDKEKKFTIDIFPDGFYEVKGSVENDRYLEYQKMNKEYRTVMYECNAVAKEQPAKKDSLQAVLLKARKTFSDYQQSFYKLYPENLMSVLVRAVTAPQVDEKYIDENGNVKKGMEAEYAYVYRSKFWDSFDFRDERIMGTPYFYKKFQTYLDKMTMQTADSVFSSLKYFIDYANSRGGELYSDYVIDLYLGRYSRLPFSFNEAIYVKMVDSLLNDEYTPWLSQSEKDFHLAKAEQIRPFLPANPFPNISARTLENKSLRLYDLKHRYTVVFFWSAGCESCKKNIEELKNFYKDNKDKYDFEIFSIEMGGNIEETKKQLQQEPFDWIVVQSNPTQINKLYGLDIDHTPEIYILDNDKRILNKTAVYQHVRAVIEQEEMQRTKAEP